MAEDSSDDESFNFPPNDYDDTAITARQDTSLPSFWSEGDVVAIFVGAKRKRYIIHKNLLIDKVPYFKTSLKDCWNGTTDEINLKEDDASAFESVVNYLYRDKLDLHLFELGAWQEPIYRLYKLADKLMIEKLKNDIVDAMIEDNAGRNQFVNFNGLRRVREHGLDGTKLGLMALHNCVKYFVDFPEDFTHDKNGINDIDDIPALMKEVITKVRDYNEDPWGYAWNAAKCEYHDHSDGSKCE